jgi:hypothetical protein
MTQNTESLRAGRLLLAVADEDLPQTVRIMHETMTEPSGIVGLVVALATVGIESAKLSYGDDWRSVMVHALNGIELKDLGSG